MAREVKQENSTSSWRQWGDRENVGAETDLVRSIFFTNNTSTVEVYWDVELWMKAGTRGMDGGWKEDSVDRVDAGSDGRRQQLDNSHAYLGSWVDGIQLSQGLGL